MTLSSGWQLTEHVLLHAALGRCFRKFLVPSGRLQPTQWVQLANQQPWTIESQLCFRGIWPKLPRHWISRALRFRPLWLRLPVPWMGPCCNTLWHPCYGTAAKRLARHLAAKGALGARILLRDRALVMEPCYCFNNQSRMLLLWVSFRAAASSTSRPRGSNISATHEALSAIHEVLLPSIPISKLTFSMPQAIFKYQITILLAWVSSDKAATCL